MFKILHDHLESEKKKKIQEKGLNCVLFFKKKNCVCENSLESERV